jgi:hypothetical protein
MGEGKSGDKHYYSILYISLLYYYFFAFVVFFPSVQASLFIFIYFCYHSMTSFVGITFLTRTITPHIATNIPALLFIQQREEGREEGRRGGKEEMKKGGKREKGGKEEKRAKRKEKRVILL